MPWLRALAVALLLAGCAAPAADGPALSEGQGDATPSSSRSATQAPPAIACYWTSTGAGDTDLRECPGGWPRLQQSPPVQHAGGCGPPPGTEPSRALRPTDLFAMPTAEAARRVAASWGRNLTAEEPLALGGGRYERWPTEDGNVTADLSDPEAPAFVLTLDHRLRWATLREAFARTRDALLPPHVALDVVAHTEPQELLVTSAEILEGGERLQAASIWFEDRLDAPLTVTVRTMYEPDVGLRLDATAAAAAAAAYVACHLGEAGPQDGETVQASASPVLEVVAGSPVWTAMAEWGPPCPDPFGPDAGEEPGVSVTVDAVNGSVLAWRKHDRCPTIG
jgi:hypothetical protein